MKLLEFKTEVNH